MKKLDFLTEISTESWLAIILDIYGCLLKICV